MPRLLRATLNSWQGLRHAVRSATEEQLGLRLKDVKVHFQPDRARADVFAVEAGA